MTDDPRIAAEVAEGADAAPPAARALLPEQLLQPGELVILMLKPSPLYIVLAPIGTLASIVIVGAIAMQLTAYSWFGLDRQDVVSATVGLLLLRLFWQFLEWLSRIYVLTDRRVIAVAGVIRVAVFEAALDKIQHTNCDFTLRERLFGLGTILFATAGTAAAEAAWVMLASPLEVHRKIIEALNRYR